MNIAGTEFNLKHNALEIYISGCKGHPCEGCHNQELWDFNVGDELDDNFLRKIENLVKDSGGLIKKIWILGGEPLDNDISSLLGLVAYIRNHIKIDELWLWTRKGLNDIPVSLLYFITHVKCGMYIKDMKPITYDEYDITLASFNQRIYRVKDVLGELVEVNKKTGS